LKKNKNIQVEIVPQSINPDRRLAAGVLFLATLYQLNKIMLQNLARSNCNDAIDYGF